MSNTAVGLFIQKVAMFTGQALVAVAAEAGLAVGGTLPAALLVGVVVAGGAAGHADPARREKGGVARAGSSRGWASSCPRSQGPF